MTTKLTITEALAEIKTINKRITKKNQFIQNYLVRQEQLKDPLDKDGGSATVLAQERQSIIDLQERLVLLRRAIQEANEDTTLSVNGATRTIADWLVWKREVAPLAQSLLSQMSINIQGVRDDARRKGLSVITTGDIAKSPNDVIINVDERQLAEEIEDLENILGSLDGQLSLKNATTFVEL